MKLTEFFRLRMPDGTDPVNIEDFNDNFEVIDKELKKRIADGESASDVTVEFEAAESRQPLKSGEKLSVLMGKAQRFFTDLKTVAFSGKYGDLSERPTLGGAAGYKVADNDTTNSSEFLPTARVAYEHGQEIDALNRNFASFQSSFRAGLSKIAAAITEMGVATPDNATPDQIVNNIRQIKSSASGSFVSGTPGTVRTAECGFRPSMFVAICADTKRRRLFAYDGRIGLYDAYSNSGVGLNNRKYSITDTGFTLETGDSSGWENCVLYWFAVK